MTLKDFQTTLKVAKGKEAASLPKQKKAAGVPCTQRGDLESGDGDSEEQALLQVRLTTLPAVSSLSAWGEKLVLINRRIAGFCWTLGTFAVK